VGQNTQHHPPCCCIAAHVLITDWTETGWVDGLTEK
jgi:hypothetical protein